MSDYIKLTNFAVKDGYVSGNPAKVIKGTELDDEFNAIATALATKADSSASSGSGLVSVKDFGAVGNGVTDDTAAIQDAIDTLSAAGGGTVFLPAGAYKITSNINITWPSSLDQNVPGRITFRGEGADLSYIYDYRDNTAAASNGAITLNFSSGYDNKFLTMYFGEKLIIIP